MKNILDVILESKRRKVELLKKNKPAIEALLKTAPAIVPFKQAIHRPGKLSLIAEIKQASPSRGILRPVFDHRAIARAYKTCGVNAVSVVTEEEFFLGKLSYITDVKNETGLPVLRKDFIVDEIEIVEARAAGADAVLLIARILDEHRMAALYAYAHGCGMDVVLEVHNEKELRKALALGADIIGINNRNLSTLVVEPERLQKLLPFIPPEIVRVSESGAASRKDMLLRKGMGCDAVLVGEVFMKAADIETTVQELHIDA